MDKLVYIHIYKDTETRRRLLACLFKDNIFISIFTIYRDFKKVIKVLDLYPLFLNLCLLLPKCHLRHKMSNNYPNISMLHLQYTYIDRENIKVIWIYKRNHIYGF